MKYIKNSSEFYFATPELKDCQYIADEIQKENAIKPHMYPIEGKELFDTIKKYGGYGIYTKQNKALAGLIKLVYVDQNIYEWGSLFVSANYRGEGIASKLIEKITQDHANKILMAVTNVPQVMQAGKKLQYTSYLKKDIPANILAIIEASQPLLLDDVVLGNNSFFNLLKT